MISVIYFLETDLNYVTLNQIIFVDGGSKQNNGCIGFISGENSKD